MNKQLLKQILPPHKIKSSSRTLIYNFKKNNQNLIILGVNHSTDPNNKNYKKIKNLFNNFVQENKNIVIALEQGIPVKLMNENKMIKLFKETGFVYYLADKNNLKVKSIEPSTKQILKFTLKQDNKKIDISSWIFLNTLLNTETKIDPLENLLKSLSKNLFNKQNIASSYKKIAKNINKTAKQDILPLDYNDIKRIKNIKKLKELENPFSLKTKINQAGNHLNWARDYFMAENIIELLTKGYNILTVLGNNHVLAQINVYKKWQD